jgi:GGDEF domain-containing protein
MGDYIHVHMKAALVDEQEGRRLIVGLNDIDVQVRQEQEYERRLAVSESQVNIDALTHVKNRHAYLDTEARINAKISGHSMGPFALVVMDLNDLKKVNDTAGHQAGDKYIQEACKII